MEYLERTYNRRHYRNSQYHMGRDESLLHCHR